MEEPLVSVVVTTFNSEPFVKETLDSVKSQTYQKIELIVSDDCSSDNTLKICREWLSVNKNRFIRTDIITVPKNTGVSANCNRGIQSAKSDWIKFIAGDDILFPQCIEANMRFIFEHPEVRVLFSQVSVYANNFTADKLMRNVPNNFPMNLMDPNFNAEDQFKILLLSDRITYTPSYFFHKEAIAKVGGYDETETLIEDYPMWLKLTRAGIRLFFMNELTVGYRKHNRASNNKMTNSLFKPLFFKSYLIRRKYAHSFLPWDIVAREKFEYAAANCFRALGITKKTWTNRKLFSLVCVYMNPFRYLIFLKKRFLKLGQKNIFYSD